MFAVTRGKPNTVELRFHVSAGFHVNSNKPSEEYLIPTVLKIDAPTDIVLGRITYPEGEQMSFAFAPDEKLSVYSGEFDLAVTGQAAGQRTAGKIWLPWRTQVPGL